MACMTKGSRVLGYIRVSSAEQADSGAGLQAQRNAVTAEAERRGWTLLGVVEDAGYSAKSLDRPGMQVALGQLARGEADALLAAKLDRLSRSLLDFAGLLERAQREGWSLVALDLGLDTTTPQGRMMARILATFAEYERQLIGQRTRDALAVKRAQGVRLGRPPVLPDEVVARIRREHEQGASLRKIAERLTDDGISTARGGARWQPSSVRAVVASERQTSLC